MESNGVKTTGPSGEKSLDKSLLFYRIGSRARSINKKGITLIELIIVLAIIAIGALLMAPNIGRWLPTYRLKTATRDVVSTMRVAQMKAVSTNVEYGVSFEGNTYILLRRNTGGGWDTEGAAQTLPTGIIIDAISFPVDPLVNHRLLQLNPNSTCSPGSVTLKNPKQMAKRISVTTATGRINVD